MNEESESQNLADLDTDAFLTPFGSMMTEVNEVYLELKRVGFPDSMSAQILAHMLSDVVLYRSDEFEEDDEDFDENDEDEDDLGNDGI